MIKFRLYIDKDEELKWLHVMSAKGYGFEKYFLGFYRFNKCEPNKYKYQIDLLDNWSGDKEDYSEFMDETKVEIVSQWYRWVFLRRKASEGEFELYSDTDSTITQYQRIRYMFKVALAIEIVCFILVLGGAITSRGMTSIVFTALLGLVIYALMRGIKICNTRINEIQHN